MELIRAQCEKERESMRAEDLRRHLSAVPKKKLGKSSERRRGEPETVTDEMRRKQMNDCILDQKREQMIAQKLAAREDRAQEYVQAIRRGRENANHNTRTVSVDKQKNEKETEAAQLQQQRDNKIAEKERQRNNRILEIVKRKDDDPVGGAQLNAPP